MGGKYGSPDRADRGVLHGTGGQMARSSPQCPALPAEESPTRFAGACTRPAEEREKMIDDHASGEGGLPLQAAAELQDDLMVAGNDLDRLQTLLAHACDTLMESFHGALAQVQALQDRVGAEAVAQAMRPLGGAITALQFQDMASQLISHTHRRLRSCADRLAFEAMGDDEDGYAVVEAAPLRPNPVTQDEMDAGSIELF
jgi:hypothetical protein